MSVTVHVYILFFLTMGAGPWAKLPADVRAILEKTARDVQGWMYAMGTQDDQALMEKLGASMKVNTADRAAFVKASKPIYDEFAKEISSGKEMINLALKLAD